MIAVRAVKLARVIKAITKAILSNSGSVFNYSK